MHTRELTHKSLLLTECATGISYWILIQNHLSGPIKVPTLDACDERFHVNVCGTAFLTLMKSSKSQVRLCEKQSLVIEIVTGVYTVTRRQRKRQIEQITYRGVGAFETASRLLDGLFFGKI